MNINFKYISPTDLRNAASSFLPLFMIGFSICFFILINIFKKDNITTLKIFFTITFFLIFIALFILFSFLNHKHLKNKINKLTYQVNIDENKIEMYRNTNHSSNISIEWNNILQLKIIKKTEMIAAYMAGHVRHNYFGLVIGLKDNKDIDLIGIDEKIIRDILDISKKYKIHIENYSLLNRTK